MPLVRPNGTVQMRQAADILQAGVVSMQGLWGGSINTRGNGSIAKLLEAGVEIGMGQVELAANDEYRQRYMQWATGQALDDAAWPFFFRIQPQQATGTINITLKTALASPTPLFAAGSVTFVDSAGVKYDLINDVNPNATTSVSSLLRCQQLGVVGNVSPNQITRVLFSSPAVESFWGANVDSVTNDAAFAGGRDRETDTEFRLRMRDAPTAREGASPSGLELALLDPALGTTGANVLENNELLATTTDTLFSSTQTGTLSELLSTGGNSRIAQRMDLTAALYRFAQYVNFKSVKQSGTPSYRVSVQTDSSGSPSGTVIVLFDESNVIPTDNVLYTATFRAGAYPPHAVAWLVFEILAGTAKLDGGAGGPANQVKLWNGSAWSLSTLANLNTSFVGGIPGRSFRAYVSGGGADDIAQVIRDNRAAGMKADGKDSGTAHGRGTLTYTEHFERPTQVPVVLRVTVKADLAIFPNTTANANLVRDLFVSYIGGVNTQAESINGLGTGDTLVRNELIRLLLDPTLEQGIFDVTELVLDRKANVTAGDPANISSGATSNLTATVGEELYIQTAATDILVSIVSV